MQSYLKSLQSNYNKMRNVIRSTTIIGVRHKGKVSMAGDGQVTFGDMSFKQKAIKVREFNF